MNPQVKLALARFGKVLASLALSSAIGFIVGPDLANLVGTTYAVAIAALLTPILSGLEKAYFPKTS